MRQIETYRDRQHKPNIGRDGTIEWWLCLAVLVTFGTFLVAVHEGWVLPMKPGPTIINHNR